MPETAILVTDLEFGLAGSAVTLHRLIAPRPSAFSHIQSRSVCEHSSPLLTAMYSAAIGKLSLWGMSPQDVQRKADGLSF